jgi:cell division protein ZapA (FtsZ GTPase activity inhibitor)
MAKPVKIVIGGREYSLRGDNEAFIQKTAEELNNQIDTIRKIYTDESSITITTLAALNIAEKATKATEKQEINERFIINEINKMTDFINSRINI